MCILDIKCCSKKIFVFKQVQPVVRHRLTYQNVRIDLLFKETNVDKLAFWCGRRYFGSKTYFFIDRKMRKTGITLQNSRNPPMGRNFAWLTSERVLNKTCDAIINENLYL